MEDDMSQLELIEPQSREAMLRDWVRRRLGSVDHEMRVGRLARTLFGVTRRWHGLGALDLRILWMAAVVHDVGRADGERNHAERGARMIRETRGLPLDGVERRRLAYLTCYHKGEVPELWEDGILDRDEDDGMALRCVLGILRAADGLDSRSLKAPSLVIRARGVAWGARVVSINGYAEDVLEAEAVFGRCKKFRLLEETLGCAVEMEWFGVKALAAAS
jgi:exopolyphosphatase/pppGpp-phosphohydrolase